MTTAVSICSNALLMLGDNPISSFDESTDRARLASNLWPTARDYVLRSHPWNCATKRVVLAPEAEVPAFDWTAQFLLPGDTLRVMSVGERGERPPYKVESGKILMNATVCKLLYIWRNENPGTWDSMLVWGMTVAMRSIFSYGIAQSATLEQVIDQALREVLKKARATDGQEDEAEALDHSPLYEARFIGSSNWG
jgi:hypothetical protein